MTVQIDFIESLALICGMIGVVCAVLAAAAFLADR